MKLANPVSTESSAPPRVPKLGVVIVSYNSHGYIEKTIEYLKHQTRQADTVLIVDSASTNTDYLLALEDELVKLRLMSENVGFCKGNNIGAQELMSDHDYVLFLNPDAFLRPEFIEKSLAYMEKQEHAKVAVLTGKLLGYNLKQDKPTGLIDSTGIFQSWQGRWHDRGQGLADSETNFAKQEMVPAICGALMLCRTKALLETSLRDNEVFDESFFMYKEDIELSLRLRKNNWQLHYVPDLVVYHCRGWEKDRRKMRYQAKYLSAVNELRLYRRHPSPYIIFAFLKYLYVVSFESKRS